MTPLLALLAWSGTASAVERFDAHGFTLAVEDGDNLDLLTLYRPQAMTPKSVSGLALFEIAGSSLVLQQQNGNQTDADPLRKPLFATNLGITGALTRRVGLGITVPHYLFTGRASLGDMRISVPLGLGVPEDGSGGTFAILPWVDLPSGDELRWLGDRGTEWGSVMAFGGTTERFQISFNMGAYTSPEIQYLNLRGGPHGILGMGMGFAVGERGGLRTEALYRPSLYLHESWRDWKSESPGELTSSYRWQTDSGLHYTAGLAVPFKTGAGTAFRTFFGLGYSYGKNQGPDTDGDGIFDRRDECINDPEDRNGYQDRDGCPDGIAKAQVTVLNDDERPVPDAAVQIHGFAGATGEDGTLEVTGLIPQAAQTGTVSHPFYAATDFTLSDLLADGDNERTIRLVFVPGEVRVTARRSDGQPINARVRFIGPDNVPIQYLGADGEGVYELRPGEWRLLISAPEFGTARHDLTIEPGQKASADIQITMEAARAVVDQEKEEVRILEQIHFDSGKDTIKAESMPLIAQVANLLMDNPYIRRVEVQGHSDAQGDDALNMELSQRRVENVTRTLVSMGVETERLLPRGYGETNPIADNDTDAGRAMNRRVQFVILEQEKPDAEEAPASAKPPPSPKKPAVDSEGL